MIHHITRATRHLLFWSVLALGIGSIAIRLIVLGVEDYKNDLESRIFEVTAIPVKIGSLRASMRGFSPEIILKDIRVLAEDADGKPAIQLEELRLGINPVQVLFSWQILPSSWLTLVGVKLSVVRKEDGTLSIAGLNMEESGQPLWLLQGRHYEILKSDISWLDEQRKGELLVFNNVDLSIRNDSDTDTHEIHFISHLPEQYGKMLRISMSFQGDVFEIDNINGMAYIEGSDIKLAELVTTEQPLGIKILAGEGSFKQWSKIEKSRLLAVSGSIQAKNILLQKQGKKAETFEINSLSTTFNAFNKADGWQLGVKDFALKTRKQIWPTAELSIFADSDLSHFAGSVTQVDLQELTELIQFFVPGKSETVDLILSMGLKGRLKDFSFYADTVNNKYAVNGVFDSIYVQASSGLPQLENLTGSIKGSNENGVISFNTHTASLYFPELFRAPYSINKLSGSLAWQELSDKWQISSESLIVDLKDIETETRVALSIPKNDAAIFMDLQASFGHAPDISHAPEYYPVTVMDEEVLDWLDAAFVSGKIEQGRVLVYGELNQFPFSEGQGVFEVLYNMNDVELHYNSEWPNLKNVDANILFLKNSVTIDLSHAEVNNLIIKQAQIEIPSFSLSDHLFVQGRVEGKIMDGLTFLQKTPIHSSVDAVLDAITPEGVTQVDLDMEIPLAETAVLAVDGVAHIDQAAVKVKAVDLDVSQVSGDLRFTEQGLFSEQINANALGFPIAIKVDSDQSNTVINVEGQTTVSQLNKQFSFLNNTFTDGRIKGLMAYRLNLGLPDDEKRSAELKIKTNLSGVSVNLPESLSKSAEQKRTLTLRLLLNDNQLLPLWLNYNDDLKVAININKQQNTMHSAHIVYGNGTAVLPKKKGINIQVEQDVFNLSEWMGIASAQQIGPALGGLSGISLNTKQLQWKNKNYGLFEIASQRFEKEWQGNLSCSTAKGAFAIPVDLAGKGKIKLDMAYLNLSEIMQVDFQIDDISTEDVSLINVVSEQLLWNGSDLGRLEIETEQLVDGVRFNQINVISKNHKIELKADWVKTADGSVTEMYGSLFADDIGDFLSQLGFDNDLKEANANFEYYGSWPGSPYQFSLATMDAAIDVMLEDGRISSIEPGFGRILGLIAMEQWVKRLTLDFGDVYKQGLTFNDISGHFKINKGKAMTNNLFVDAVPARISIRGEAGLLAKTLNYTVQVVPKSSGALPIAGTIVSGIAGVITQVLTNDYEEGYFFGSKYKVTGQWDDFTVTPLHEQDGILKKTWTGLTDFPWM